MVQSSGQVRRHKILYKSIFHCKGGRAQHQQAPGGVRIRSAVLAPPCVSPSAAATGSTAHFFIRTNPSAVAPVTHSASSAAPRPAFLRLSTALPRSAFSPSFAPGIGSVHVRSTPRNTFQDELIPGNALARVRLSPGLPHST